MTPLDFGKDHIHFFVFKDGTLLDFRKPFTEQLTRVTKELRISRYSPLSYQDFKALPAECEAAIGDYCTRFKNWLKLNEEYDSESFEPFRDELMSMISTGLCPAFSTIVLQIFGGDESKIPMSLYRVCQDAEALSGHRMGLDETLTCIGHLGNNGKGTHRALVEMLCGTHDQQEQLGYSCQFSEESLQSFDSGARPKQETSNARGCKFVFGDDLDVSKPLNSAVVRQFATTANPVQAHGKNEKTRSWFPVARLDLLTNDEFEYRPSFKRADHRRLSVMTYGITFFAAGDPAYDPTNPNHMIIDSAVRDNIANYIPEYLLWCRHLAGCSKLRDPRPSFLAPRPPEVRDEAARLCPTSSIHGPLGAAAKKFVATRLRLVTASTTRGSGEKPSTAAEVHRAFIDFCSQQDPPINNVTVADAQTELGNRLVYVGVVTKVAGTSIKAFYKKTAGGLAQSLRLV